LPGIALAESQDNKEEAKQVAAEKKVEQIEADREAKADAKAAEKANKHNPVIYTNQPPSQPVDMNETLPDTNDGSQTNPAAGLY
jgi:hypothetical protein